MIPGGMKYHLNQSIIRILGIHLSLLIKLE